MPYYERQPTIYPLNRLLEEVLDGEIRVPRFQRPGTETSWTAEQRGDLLDSIYRNFPIGTILLWHTTEEIGTMEAVGGAKIPPPKSGDPRRRLVLDGHQRLSTLISILGPASADYSRSEDAKKLHDELWVLDIGDDSPAKSVRERFVCYRRGATLPVKALPLEVAYDRVELNRWVRERNEKLSSDEVKRADALRDRFREYSVPVATLAVDNLDEATESFKRINSSGTPMSDFHMVTALAYSNDFDPQVVFQEAREEHLTPLGWDSMADTDLLRVCAGLVRHRHDDQSQHPSKIKIDALARSIKDDPSFIEDAVKSVAAATDLLADAGVHGPDILPYSWQLIVLAIELGSRPTLDLEPQERLEVERWFWLTTYGGVFAGVNSSVVDKASAALKSMMSGDGPDAMDKYITAGVEQPERFDFRAARSKACMLSMARYLDGPSRNGTAHRSLSRGIGSVHAIYYKQGRSRWYNLMIGDPEDLQEVRRAAWARVNERSDDSQNRLLEQHAIPATATGPMTVLLDSRRAQLWEYEKAFVKAIGMDVVENEPQQDTDSSEPPAP